MPNNQFVAMTTCFCCGESKDILLNTRLRDISHLDKKCVDKEPCPKCKDLMKQGVILISVRDGEESDNPYRTGGFWVVRDQFIQRIISPPGLAENIINRRMAFVPDSACVKLGLIIASKPAGQ